MGNYAKQKLAFISLGFTETCIGFFEKENNEVWFDVNSGNIDALIDYPNNPELGAETVGWLKEGDYTVEQIKDFIEVNQNKKIVR